MELTKNELRRQDFVDNKIHWLLSELFEDIQPYNQQGSIHWNIEDIARVRDEIYSIFEGLGVDEFTFYPYLDEKSVEE